MSTFKILLLFFSNILCLTASIQISSSCSCNFGDYFACPEVSDDIFRCGAPSPVKIESWTLCSKIGSKCTNPVILESACYYALITSKNERNNKKRALVLAPAMMSGGLGDDAILHSIIKKLKTDNVSVVMALKDIDKSHDPAFQNFALRLYQENVDEFRDISREFYSKSKLFEDYATNFDRVFFTPTDRVDGYYGCKGNGMRWLNNVKRVVAVTNVTVVGYSFDLEKAKTYCPDAIEWFYNVWNNDDNKHTILLIPRDMGSFRSTVQAMNANSKNGECKCRVGEYFKVTKSIYRCGMNDTHIKVEHWHQCVQAGNACTGYIPVLPDTCLTFMQTYQEEREESETEISKTGKVIVRLGADPAFHLKPSSLVRDETDIWFHRRVLETVEWIEKQKRDGRIIVAMNVNLHSNAMISQEQYLREAVDTVLALMFRSNASVLLVAHDFRGGQSDSDFGILLFRKVKERVNDTQRLATFLEDKSDIRYRFFSSRHIKQIIQRVDFVVTGRMHLSICAISSSVPALVISHQPKYRELMSYMGLENVAVVNAKDIFDEKIKMKDVVMSWITDNTYKFAKSQVSNALPMIRAMSAINFNMHHKVEQSSLRVVHRLYSQTEYERMLYGTFPIDMQTVHGNAMEIVNSLDSIHDSVMHISWLWPYLCGVNADLPANRLIDWIENDGPRRSRVSIVWTVHNRIVHNIECRARTYETELKLRKVLAASSSLVHIMCPNTLNVARRDGYPIMDNTAAVIAHSGYPSSGITDEQLFRKVNNIPYSDILFVVFGNMRKYKGIERIVQAFERFQQGLVEKNAHLYIIGPARYELKLKNVSGVNLIQGRLSESVLNSILKASDASVFNFNPDSFLNSGSVMKSLSVGLPVVAPRIGCLESYLVDDFSVTFDASNPLGLEQALQEASQRLVGNDKARKAASSFARTRSEQMMSMLFRRRMSLL